MTGDDSRDIWNRLAPWWDAAVGDGNEFQSLVIEPATDRLLEPKAGQVILDVACGNGQYARKLAKRGAKVVAVDFAEAFIDAARERGAGIGGGGGVGGIDYRVADATDEGQMLALGAGAFDSAVCNMAMMDLPTLTPLLRALRGLVKPGGRFVFSVSHPCFNSNGAVMFAELVNERGRLEQVYGVKITRYLEESAEKSAGILNQPEPHWMYHRPIAKLLGDCFEAGWVVDGMEEPGWPAGNGGRNAFSWGKRPGIPGAVVVRVR